MHRFFRIFSSPTEQPAVEVVADTAAPSDSPTQPPLPLQADADDEASSPPTAPSAPPSRKGRALHATQHASTTVAVTPREHLPVLPTAPPHPCAPGGGVVLTQTERVRLRIMQAQIRLAGLSLYDGPIDGMLTLETATALRYFQTLKGLRESGQPTAATLRALGIPHVG
jgi:hypothetical protein